MSDAMCTLYVLHNVDILINKHTYLQLYAYISVQYLCFSLSVAPSLQHTSSTRKMTMGTSYGDIAPSCQGSRESTQRAVGETRGHSCHKPCGIYWGQKKRAERGCNQSCHKMGFSGWDVF